MLTFIVLLALVLAMILGVATRHKGPPNNRLPTLLVDPIILIVSGLVMVVTGLAVKRPKDGHAFRNRRQLLRAIAIMFMILFWVGVALYYFGVLDGPYGTPGNDFAWNGYIDLLGLRVMDTSTPTYNSWWKNLIALSLALSQPFFLWIGYRLGYVIGGFQDLDLWTRKPSK
jgi:hypothetical protein